MISILFVCSGDTCRSPMAAAILQHKIKNEKIKNLKVSSCGICVNETEKKINANSKFALSYLGVQTTRHSAVQCSLDLLENNDFVITMTYGQKKIILEKYVFLENVFCVAEFINGVDVLDPYGKGKTAYVEVARYLDFATDQILEKFLKANRLIMEK